MTKPAVTEQDLEDRRQRQEEWRELRKKFLYSQRRLAEALKISLRDLQYVEAGAVTPVADTLLRFRDLKNQCAADAREMAA
jgi:predicted transcriptional regulator